MMRWGLIAFVLLMVVAAPPVNAQPQRLLNIDVSAKTIEVTTGFNGAALSVHGVRKGEGDVAVVVHGPSRPVIVRRKGPFMRLWLNSASMAFEDVPAYYNLALSQGERGLAPHDVLRRYAIGLDALDFAPVREDDPDMVNTFREAMIRNQQTKGLFPMEPKSLSFVGRDFFRADFDLPASVTTGTYRIEAFLIRDGQVVDRQRADVRVVQTGFNADIFLFSKLHGFLYGLSAVMMALLFGLGAHVFLRRD